MDCGDADFLVLTPDLLAPPVLLALVRGCSFPLGWLALGWLALGSVEESVSSVGVPLGLTSRS